MKYFRPLVPYLVGLALLLTIPVFRDVGIYNTIGQAVLFILWCAYQSPEQAE